MFNSPTTNNVNFKLTVEEIQLTTKQLMNSYKQVYDDVANITEGRQTFKNTVLSIAEADAKLAPIESSVDFLQYVSTNKEIRDASSAASTELAKFGVEMGMREDVFKSLSYVEQNSDLSSLDPVDRRLLRFSVRDFERNGLALPEETRKLVQQYKQELSKLQIDYSKNLNEENSKYAFTKEDLEGLPADFLESLQKGDKEGEYLATLQYPDVIPILESAKKDTTRRRLDIANQSKCIKENTPLLEEALLLRRKIASLLGFKNYAEYILQVRMAKTPATVIKFESELAEKLQKLKETETAEWLRLKKAEKEARGEEFDGKIHSYDWNYYHTKNMIENFQVDDEEIKKYFPMEVVTNGMFEVYEQVLSLKFIEIPNPSTWHESVRMFAVHDKDSGEFIGHFYLDLHPREGKYGHAAVFPLQPRCEFSDGTIQHPVAAMVANFTKPTPDRPSLLKFDEVVTYFHEFGHVMHGLCTKSKYSRFSGTNVERDFVEAPSQMLENWCYEAPVLEKLSGHFQNNSEKLPASMLQSLVKAKNADTALLNLRQIFFGMFDQTIHSSEEEKIDTGKLYAEFREKYTGVPPPAGTNGAAGFGHLMGGYEAQYYGYLYSQVFSADMFEAFKKHPEGVFSQEVGKRYRDLILAPGGSKDSLDSLIEFLGREPTPDAFLKSIGLSE